jgi:hypothetical protein
MEFYVNSQNKHTKNIENKFKNSIVIFHLLCLRLIFIWHYFKNLVSYSKQLFNITCKETSEMVRKPYIMKYPNVSNSKYSTIFTNATLDSLCKICCEMELTLQLPCFPPTI